MAIASAEVQRSALRRAELGVESAEAERRSAEAQAKAAQARRDEALLELQRHCSWRGPARRPTARSPGRAPLGDTSEAELRVALEQVEARADAIEIARAEVQMALANVANAHAAAEEKRAVLDEAEVELDRTVIRAPIDGIVISREVNPGQAVAAGLETKTLFRIARDLSEMQVKASIDEADVGTVKEGEATEFTVDAYPNRVFQRTRRSDAQSARNTAERRHLFGDCVGAESREAALSRHDRCDEDRQSEDGDA